MDGWMDGWVGGWICDWLVVFSCYYYYGTTVFSNKKTARQDITEILLEVVKYHNPDQWITK